VATDAGLEIGRYLALQERKEHVSTPRLRGTHANCNYYLDGNWYIESKGGDAFVMTYRDEPTAMNTPIHALIVYWYHTCCFWLWVLSPILTTEIHLGKRLKTNILLSGSDEVRRDIGMEM